MSKAALSGKYAAYPEYKDSDVEWLGMLPNHWDLKPIKYIFKIENGSTPKSGISEYWDGDITWITPSDLSKISTKFISSSSRCITFAGFNSCGTSLTPKNSLVISSRAPIGSLAITTKESCTNQGCKSLVSKSKNNNIIYIYYIFSIATEQLNLLGRGTTFLELSSDDLGKFSIPYPPLNEQTQIAAFLDHETAKIDTLIEKQQQLIELLKEKRQAVISHAVTKGLNPDAPMKDSGVEWLGEVPEHWELPRLKQIIQSGSSISYGIVQPGDALDEGVPFIQTTNISQGTLAREALPKTSALIEKNYPRSRLMGGEVILGIRASIGAAYVVPNELRGVNLSRGIARIQPNNQISSEFLVWLFKTNAVEQYWGLSKQGSTFSEVSIETVREMNVLVPPMQEQQLICKELNLISNKYDQLINAALAQNTLLRERRTALISAAVTGKIDVRHFTLENGVTPATSSDTNEAVQEVMA
ncbi:TPA: restriction endonuclease subunit S [Photobacterium damselae]